MKFYLMLGRRRLWSLQIPCCKFEMGKTFSFIGACVTLVLIIILSKTKQKNTDQYGGQTGRHSGYRLVQFSRPAAVPFKCLKYVNTAAE